MEINKFEIRLYEMTDENQLFDLIEREGEDWEAYWLGLGRSKYKKALSSSINYVLYKRETLCGYIRCRDDDGFGVYVYDLLVDRNYRGREYGRLLMERVCRDFPDDTVYAMSGVDPFYEKLGYEKEGTIFTVKG